MTAIAHRPPAHRARTDASWARRFAERFTAGATRSTRWTSPVALASDLDPHYRVTPALTHIDEALVWAANTPDARLIISLPPQEGKSTTANRWFSAWLLSRRPSTRIVIASYAATVARRMGRAIRTDIAAHPQLGIRLRDDVNAQHEFEIAGHTGGVYAVGIGGALTSRPADALLIDDPLKDRAQADSKVYRDRVWDWWTDTASARLSPGAPVVLVLTRWHDDDLAGRLLAAEDGKRWRVVNIPAQADHRPEHGESDVLGRAPGEFMVSARGRTTEQWEQRKTAAGSRTWASLYQGRPSPQSGDIFHLDWFDGAAGERRYDQPLWIERHDGSRIVTDVDDTGTGPGALLISSWDFAFKGDDRSDFVVGQVWLRRGADAYLLDQVRRRMDFPETIAAFRAMAARWPQALLKLVEDKANGPAVIASLRGQVPGILPDDPQGSKISRATGIAPLVEAGNVHLPTVELAPWVADLTTEATAFPNGANDDQVDAMSQALDRLILQPLLAGEDLTVDADAFTDGDDYLSAWS